ncbi:MAG: ABC transporter permease [Nanoarchaeota archaeon]
MRFNKCFKHAFGMVVHSRLRSWLTIVGIVIGVAAVIAILSMSQGLQQQVDQQLGSLGGDILTLTAGFSRGGNFFEQRGPGGGSGGSGSQAVTKEVVLGRSDVQALRGIPDVLLINTNIRGTVNVSYLGKAGKLTLTGVDQAVWSQITTSTIKEGRMLDSADQNVVVIGGRLAASYFSKPIGINKMITIQGNAFRVVGILNDQSNDIIMPIAMAYQVIPDKTIGVYDSITIKIRDQDLLDETIAKIEQRLMMVRHVTNSTKDFSLTSSKQFQETRAAAMSTMTTFLVAIAAVSLIVGAVGVANTMFTSVMEKTKEIGIMKAIGARNHDILLIFLFNAGLIGMTGGLLGSLLGVLLSAALPIFLGGGIPFIRQGSAGGTVVIAPHYILLALGVSLVVGMVAGIIPAYQASKLKPVDALRYE